MTRSLRPVLAAALGFALATGTPALAQEKVYRSADAVSGKSVRLSVHGNVSKDCKAGPLPEIKIVTPPKHGALAVRQGKVEAGRLKRCPKLEVPVEGVFYQANANYTGEDEVAYEVRRAGAPVQALTVKITVGAQAKPGTGAKETTDL
ncbi:MAG TPA: 4-aminobutyrate aminotransferase [Beijerinckiaceae bacterium]|jgi:hypothetical protein